MRNITVSVDEETHRAARILAAEAGTSISALTRECLKIIAQSRTSEERFQRLRRLQDEVLEAIRARGGGLKPADRLRREALYDRDALRREHKEHLRRDALR